MGGRKVQREVLLSANSLPKILIPLKASKECFFPVEGQKKKKIQLPSKMEGLNEHSSPTCHKPLAELLKEIP